MGRSASFDANIAISNKLDASIVNELVTKLRATGDEDAKEKLILSHMRLALYIAGRYMVNNRRRQDDLISAALYGLTVAVDKSKHVLKDNNITPYIYVTVEHYVRDFVFKDSLVPIPRETYKKMQASGGIGQFTTYFEMTHLDDTDEENWSYPELIDRLPSVSDDVTNLELDEFKKKIHRDDDTLVYVLDRLIEGYTYREISDEIGVTHSRIQQLVKIMRNNYFGEKACTLNKYFRNGRRATKCLKTLT